jgi:hypothetical protein
LVGLDEAFGFEPAHRLAKPSGDDQRTLRRVGVEDALIRCGRDEGTVCAGEDGRFAAGRDGRRAASERTGQALSVARILDEADRQPRGDPRVLAAQDDQRMSEPRRESTARRTKLSPASGKRSLWLPMRLEAPAAKRSYRASRATVKVVCCVSVPGSRTRATT